MQRRSFNQALTLAASGAALYGTSAHAQKKIEAGTDYLVLDPRAPVEAPAGKVEVVEFFWYSCPHCNAFEPTLAAWVKRLPKYVAFRRVPVAFREDFVPQQRLYFALEAMGLLEKLHSKVFAAIHVERLQLADANAIGDWVASQKVNRDAFMQQFNSFSVASKAKKGKQLQDLYSVEGVPAMGVAGRYYTDATLSKSMERALQVVEVLVADVRAGK